jgi:hypothetical protein
LPASSLDLWEVIADEAAAESPLWAEALLAPADRELVPVFSPLLRDTRHDVGLDTIYEGYLLHYGRARLFAADGHNALLLGDYLYAHGLVRIAAREDVDAVADLAALISLCAQLQADGDPGDGEAWAATAALLGSSPLRESRDPSVLGGLAGDVVDADALDRALSLHSGRVG